MKSISLIQIFLRKLLFIVLVTICFNVSAQDMIQLKGIVIDSKSKEAIPNANITLSNPLDSTLICGTISNLNGEFCLGIMAKRLCKLKISMLGYESFTRKINTIDLDKDLWTIALKEKAMILNENLVVGARIKAKSSLDKTTFFINKKIYNSSNTGLDILKYIPGVQVDLIQNISLNGNSNILIYINGVLRDKNYLNQLNASDIDKVEVSNVPDSKYDANISGVINIILKKNELQGVSGHVYSEIPTKDSEIYLFPNASLNYGFKNINIYASYNGKFTYFDITKNNNRDIYNEYKTTRIISYQDLRQKNWDHRVNYGLDIFINKNNYLNLYSYYNTFSFEQDGFANTLIKENSDAKERYSYTKDDTDKNYRSFYSLYYKHLFRKSGSNIAIDMNYYNFNAENSTLFEDENNLNDMVSFAKPKQNTYTIKIDYSSPLSEITNLISGIKTEFNRLRDREDSDFKYYNNTLAIYSGVNIKFEHLDLNIGLRCENSNSGIRKGFKKHYFDILPSASMNIKFSPKANLRLLYRYSIRRPELYRLIPNSFISDPYSVSKGNPQLDPEYEHSLLLDYSVRFKTNYISSALFYSRVSDAINSLTVINGDNYLESKVYNLGNIYKIGMKLSGTINIGKSITVNPYLKLYDIYTKGNSIAYKYEIKNRHRIAMESGLSAMVSFKKNISASFLFQYNSKNYKIQKSRFYDPLYFISLEKTFNKNLKIGITTAIPFTKSMTYYGTKIKGMDFNCLSEGKIHMSKFPFWLKLKYQFSSGKIMKRIKSRKEKTISTRENMGIF